jgi:hypothetical protein
VGFVAGQIDPAATKTRRLEEVAEELNSIVILSEAKNLSWI